MFNRRDSCLRVCALGFDARSYTALQLFFRGKCSDTVELVGDDEAVVGIIDMDSYNARKILAEQEERHPSRWFILLSLESQQSFPSNAIHIKKPVQIQHMMDALNTVRSRLADKPARAAPNSVPVKSIPGEGPTGGGEMPDVAGAAGVQTKVFVARTGAAKKTNQTAILLDERGFGEYIGSLNDIDPTNPLEVRAAQYDPKRYFQGYLQSAYKVATERNCALRLNTGWKPVTIFPETREVWVDADDQQLRSFCLVPVHSISELDVKDTSAGVMTISPASAIRPTEIETAKLQRMDALMWKVALWTSAGRIPEDIDLNRPVYLRNWPNFTRLLVFPGAIRIAALLAEQPRSLPDVAESLNLRQQYVFAFFSAARALGLAGQALRQSENLMAPPPIEPRKNAGVLKKILQRLLRR